MYRSREQEMTSISTNIPNDPNIVYPRTMDCALQRNDRFTNSTLCHSSDDWGSGELKNHS